MIRQTRPFVAFAIVATIFCGETGAPASAQQAPWPMNDWTRAEPAAHGIDPAPFDALGVRIRNGDFGLVDRMIVIRNGYLVVDETYPHDYREISRGVTGPLGCGIDACDDAADVHAYNYYHPDRHPFFMGRDVHTLQSVTKSIAATMLGIAITRGDIASADVPLLSFLGAYDLSGIDPRLHDATLDDLLTMRTGIEWHEQDRPLDETNTTLQLERSQDWVRFTLAQPMDAAPGEKWVYNSGGSHLMSAVIRDATGQTIDTYAERHLFDPLGITDYHWKKTPTGLPDTEGGLYLEATQLAKIGYLYLRGGTWHGRRILSREWVDASTAKQVENVNPNGWGYGYQWWRLDQGSTVVWAGLGFGGQFLLILPEHDLIGVINAWNLFGGSQAGVLGPFIQALIAAAS
jgi:CubicO group peptidase (beta-lactamase class C family)